ncbi:hypothetical protein FNV43_RR05392 [Rhamnella rubrinervis]|uniref:Uncharacterized protein n=1 Tax=Rhamnella rubrinervis TaxID=2594499 RepID=A0A8K0HMJ3_9ROSA|nr:hypothetical protein FNV43_RR05392 [Rhamnella rubrinervis]
MVPMPKSNEPPAYKTNLGLKDSSSIRLDPKSNPNRGSPRHDGASQGHLAQTSRFLYEAIVKVDAACKKKTTAYESSAETNKTLQASNKTLEANNLHLKQAAADANSRAEHAELKLLQAEKKWSETDQKLAEKNKELEALADFSTRAAERDEVTSSSLAWPRKKKIAPSGVEDAYLRAQKEMILKFKAGQTSWATPEPSEDDSDDGEGSEISSGEDEPEPNNESLRTAPPREELPHERTRLTSEEAGLTP